MTPGRYRLLVSSRVPESDEEREPNWKRELATTVDPAGNAIGMIGWKNDTDWYSWQPERGAAATRLNLDLDGVDGITFSLALWDHRGRLLLKRRGGKSRGIQLNNVQLPGDGADPIYVELRGGGSFNAEASYGLRLSLGLQSGSEEVEPNDTLTQSKPCAVRQNRFWQIDRSFGPRCVPDYCG